MTTTQVMTITDEQIAEIERDIEAQASIKHGQCEGGVVVRGEICRECGATPKDSCRRPLPKSYAVPSNVTALISRLRAAEKDAERYRWLCKSAWYVGPEPRGDTESVSWHDHNETMNGVTDAVDAAMEKSK